MLLRGLVPAATGGLFQTGVPALKTSSTLPPCALTELKALRRVYGDAQRRCTDQLVQLHRRNRHLEAEVMRLRARVIARDTALMWARQDQGAALPVRQRARLASAVMRRIGALATHVQELLRMLPNFPGRRRVSAVSSVVEGAQPAAAALIPVNVLRVRGVEGSPAPIESSSLDAQGLPPAGAVDGAAGPVSGGAGSPAIVRLDGRPDDDGEDISDLEKRLVEADLVICQTGCLSHDAYWRMQDHCRRLNKPCVLVAQPDALRIVRIHNRVEP